MSPHTALANERHPSYGSVSTVAQKRADDVEEVPEVEAAPEVVTERASNEAHLIGIPSAIFMIVSRMIGAAIFMTPSTILAQSGSVGLFLLMWIVGGVIAYLGMQVYVVWGTAIPRNGGDKNYVEYLFPKPKGLATSTYAAYATLIGSTAGNCIAFSQYLFKALLIQTSPASGPSLSSPSAPSETNSFSLKLTAFTCITFCMLVHGLLPSFGVKLQSAFGVLKIAVIAFVVGSGIIAFTRGPWHANSPSSPPPGPPYRNKNFENIWEGTTTSPAEFCTALYSVLWGYGGYYHINYALAEVKSPKRTLRIAGPLATALVAFCYISANLAYLAAASKEEIVGSSKGGGGEGEGRVLVAALLFRNVWGPGRMERVLDGFVAMCAMGNVLSVMYTQGRVNQELAKEGALPASKFWASSFPVGAPLAGLSLHWLVCTLVIFGISAKDAYQFVINVRSYPGAVINVLISFGLIYLSSSSSLSRPPPSTPSTNSDSDNKIPKLSTFSLLSALMFGLANTFLLIAPFVPPPEGSRPYESLPYWIHIVGGWAVFGLGMVWWVVWRWGDWRR